MPIEVRVPVDVGDEALVARAASWLRAFYPDIMVLAEGRYATLSSGARDGVTLRAAWASTLANERLHARAVEGRAAAFAELAR